MSGLSSLSVSVAYICVGVSILSLLLPQKRTRRIMSFAIGLFFISTLLTGIKSQADGFSLDEFNPESLTVPEHSETELYAAVAQKTADNLTAATAELLKNEGIDASDIQLTLKISDEGRIYVHRAVIYIDKTFKNRKNDIESIVYRNLSKEPEIYVTEQACKADDG